MLTTVLEVIQYATFDPGHYVKRERLADGDYEPLHVWQARAVLTALEKHGEVRTEYGSRRRNGTITIIRSPLLSANPLRRHVIALLGEWRGRR